MNIKKILFTISSFILGFSFGLVFKVAYENASYRPYTWETNKPPTIVNCYGKDFSELQMIRAIEYWSRKGEDIGLYEHNPSDDICSKTWLEGFIILRKSDNLKENTLANTRRYTVFSSMKGSVISYKPGSFNLNLINEHELGHALGYAHVDVVGHIMHPIYHKMGRNFWIP